MGFIEEQRPKVSKWLETIRVDVQALVVHNHIFWEVQAIIRKNERLAATPSVFYEWLAQIFAGSAVMGVRRQVDLGSDAVSLLKLITLLKEHPKILSRSYYMSLYDTDSCSQSRAAGIFARHAGDDAEHFEPEYFEHDIEELRGKTLVLRHFADREIAHRDPRELEYERPRFDELTDAVEFLEGLTIKYLALLKAESWSGLLPAFQYDWTEVFMIPWIHMGPDGGGDEGQPPDSISD